MSFVHLSDLCCCHLNPRLVLETVVVPMVLSLLSDSGSTGEGAGIVVYSKPWQHFKRSWFSHLGGCKGWKKVTGVAYCLQTCSTWAAKGHNPALKTPVAGPSRTGTGASGGADANL